MFLPFIDFLFSEIKLCFGCPVDSELLDFIRTEVGHLQESVKLSNEVDKVLIMTNAAEYIRSSAKKI